MQLDAPETLIANIAAGKMVILMDDEDRENEGDFIMAAEHLQPEDVNFMTRYGRGLFCMPMAPSCCQQLGLALMVPEHNKSRYGTNFTVSIEAAAGVTTGISTADRARTVAAACAEAAKPEDIVQPGHVFPLMAKAGGVLERPGHTEAAVDLARLAGLRPQAVLIEILNDDGSMARRPQLEVVAQQHGLAIGTIADLIQYRRENEVEIAV